MTTLEEAMEEVQDAMQRIAEKAKWYKLSVFLIGDFYEIVAAEKQENLEKLHA